MKNKAFTLIELIIVIAILAIIILIGTVAYGGIQQRMRVRADKATAAQIGKALVVREVDEGSKKPIEYYPTVKKYDEIEDVDNYISKGIKPQSMEEGYFVATAIQTESGKKIIVGIEKDFEEIINEPYVNNEKTGWLWSEDKEINEFLEENKEVLGGDEDTLPDDSDEEEGTIYTLTVNPDGGTWSDTGSTSPRTFTGVAASRITIPTITKEGGTTLILNANGGTINGSSSYTVTERYLEGQLSWTGMNGSWNSSTGVYTFGNGNDSIRAGFFSIYSLRQYSPTRAGYTLSSWNTRADGSGNSAQVNHALAVFSTETWYAQWVAN